MARDCDYISRNSAVEDFLDGDNELMKTTISYRISGRILFVCACAILVAGKVEGGSWMEFRGPERSGREVGKGKLPDEIGPEKNVLWKSSVPAGHSSPVLSEDRIFLTAIDEKKRLLTICLDRASGKQLWEREAVYETLEKIHRIGSFAQASPVTDGELVVSFFGSSGVWCHDLEGNLLWSKRMGPFKNDFGSGSSPIIDGEFVILAQDHDTDSFLMKLNKRTGEIIWQIDRSEFPRNFSTPLIWNNDGKKEIVIAATLRIVGYDFESGQENWSVGGVARIINMSPIAGDDGNLYVACWAPGGDENARIQVDPFDILIKESDKNVNNTIEEDELGDPAIKQRFSQIDRDKSGSITETEWEGMRRVFDNAKNQIVAIKPGGTGDITKTHVLWSFNRQLPYCPTPLFVDGRIYMVKDGGIFTALDSKSGQVIKQGRVSGTGSYYASPVYGDGRIFVVSVKGELSIIHPDAEWSEVGEAEFNEDVYSTPAIVDGKIYFRTAGTLYCFGINQVAAK